MGPGLYHCHYVICIYQAGSQVLCLSSATTIALLWLPILKVLVSIKKQQHKMYLFVEILVEGQWVRLGFEH